MKIARFGIPFISWQLACVSLFFSATASSQQYPASTAGCRVSSSGVQGCSFWTSLPKDHGGNPPLLVTKYVLEPGAPLQPPIAGRDAVVVGISEGTLLNENASEGR